MAYLVIDITSKVAIVAPPAQRNAALRKAFDFIGNYWHKNYKMLKFTNAATSRYGLAPRKGEPGSGQGFRNSYTEAKLKRHKSGNGVRAIGETKPFVWGGKSRSDAKASTKVVSKAVRGYGSAACIINAPTLNLRSKNQRVNMRDEFERVSLREELFLAREGLLIYEIELLSKRGERNRFSA